MKTGDLVMLGLVGIVGFAAYELYVGNWSFAGGVVPVTTGTQGNTVVNNSNTPTGTSSTPNPTTVTNILMPTRASNNITTTTSGSNTAGREHR